MNSIYTAVDIGTYEEIKEKGVRLSGMATNYNEMTATAYIYEYFGGLYSITERYSKDGETIEVAFCNKLA